MRRLRSVALVSILAACGDAAPPPRTVAAPPPAAPSPRTPTPPDDPTPLLRTGALKPVDSPDVGQAKLLGRFVGDGYEILQAPVALPSINATVAMDSAAGQPAPYAFTLRNLRNQDAPAGALWIRRPVEGAPVNIDLFVPATMDSRGGVGLHGQHQRLQINDTKAGKSDPAVKVLWLRSLAERLVETKRSAWSVFANARLLALATSLAPKVPTKKKAAPPPRAQIVARTPQGHDDLARMMETTTGSAAVQEALQADRGLFALVAKEPLTIPMAKLALPALGHHPWATMTARLPPPPPEPLASDAPADFYYLRAADLTALFHLLDQVDAWGTPAAHALDAASEDRDLTERYETQLALKRGPLTRALGPSVIGDVAVVGSDPYVREGTDVTVLLRVKSRALFDVALAATLAELEGAHGKLTRETRDHGGVTVTLARSADGAVAQQRATVGDLEVISNSAHALDLVLDTAGGRHPKLADEPDFRFMLARDATLRADVLAYMGDRFVGEVVGPRQKVLEARREIALGELETPGFAALLYGTMQGKSPATVDDLFAAGLLAKDEMKHASGAPIAWKPGSAARSTWGTPAAMTPLIDLPAPTLVSASEKASYERFASNYQNEWKAYIDPVAVRLAFDGQTVSADLRELPLIDGTDYRDLAGFVGAAGFTTGDLDGGARVVIGIGEDSEVRRVLTGRVRSFAGGGMKLDFLGEWAALGIADRSLVAQTVIAFGDDLPQLPEDESAPRHERLELVAQLPIYAEVAVKSPAQAALALAGLRLMANETIPGMFEWGEVARHRDVPVVRIAIKKDLTRGLLGRAPDVTIFYAVTEGALILTLQQWVLEQRIDDQLDGTAPKAKPRTLPGSTQLSFALASQPGKAIASIVTWALAQKMRETGPASREAAEVLFHGAPELAADPAAMRALALAYFGASPVTPEGAAYVPAREGAKDPSNGTPFAPAWPELPVTGSPIAKLIAAIANVRTDVAFDDEGKDDAGKAMRSLHAHATFSVR